MGGGHSQKKVGLVLGPLFWELPYPRALPYTKKKNAGLVVRGKMVLK
jgi:hypothetical protein